MRSNREEKNREKDTNKRKIGRRACVRVKMWV